MTTKIDLKRTLETCERATEGPWRVRGSTDEIGDDTNDILAWAKGNCNVCSDVDVDDLLGAFLDADADFIAHARTALPQYTEALEEAVGLLRDSPVEECPAPEPDKCGCYAAILGRFLSRFEEE